MGGDDEEKINKFSDELWKGGGIRFCKVRFCLQTS